MSLAEDSPAVDQGSQEDLRCTPRADRRSCGEGLGATEDSSVRQWWSRRVGGLVPLVRGGIERYAVENTAWVEVTWLRIVWRSEWTWTRR